MARRPSLLRKIRNIVLSISILIIIFVGAGVLYILLTGDEINTTADQKPVAKTEESSSIPKPKQPSPNAPVGVSVQSLMSPVTAGANSSISVRTLPGASCTISVTYNNVPSKDSGLVTRNADDYGSATWSWTVDKTAPAGKWPVKVTCTLNKKSGMVIGDLQVAK